MRRVAKRIDIHSGTVNATLGANASNAELLPGGAPTSQRAVEAVFEAGDAAECRRNFKELAEEKKASISYSFPPVPPSALFGAAANQLTPFGVGTGGDLRGVVCQSTGGAGSVRFELTTCIVSKTRN